MSTYDAYNLSLRDSTEFTVPSGGSGGDSDLSIATLTIDISSLSVDNTSIKGPFIYDDEESNENKIAVFSYAVDPSAAVDNILTAKIALYKGKAAIASPNIESFSGNISSAGVNAYFVTGDATIVLYNGSV